MSAPLAHHERICAIRTGDPYLGPYFTVFTVFVRLSAPSVRREGGLVRLPCAFVRDSCALPRLPRAVRARNATPCPSGEGRTVGWSGRQEFITCEYHEFAKSEIS